MNNKVGKRLVSVILLSGVLVVGCQSKDKEGGMVDNVKTLEELPQMKVISKTDLISIEDERFDVEEIQKKLDEINEGVRLDSYEKYFENEQAIELPKGFEVNNNVYTKVRAEDLSEGTHLVYVGKDTCPYCNLLRVNLDQVVEQLDFGMDYVDVEEGNNEEVLVRDLGLKSIPQIQVYHEGEVVAELPKKSMYFEEGVDFESLANGVGDLINIYLNSKYDLGTEVQEGEG